MDARDQLTVNTLRMLSVDMINKANSGHPGLPLGAAPMAHTLFSRVMVQNPKNPSWPNRDRFILSAGHGSALLYSLLHLSGFALSLDDLKAFRQLGSKTPGHPEYGHTPGVEATTGPLGQGLAMAVGMAMAEVHLAGLYNEDQYPIMDHHTYFLCGDGDLMEGVSQEAAALAGHLKLGKLIGLYDSNHVSLDGPLSLSTTEDTGKRFEAYGWQVLHVQDGNNLDAIEEALKEAKKETDRPSLIEINTTIGYGAPDQGSSKVHGSPIGEEGRAVLAKNLSWERAPFDLPKEAYDLYEEVAQKGEEREKNWKRLFEAYEKAFPEKARLFQDTFAGKLPEGWDKNLPVFHPEDKAQASRASSYQMIQQIAKACPSFWGGSADLSGSNKTDIQDSFAFRLEKDAGRNVNYGVREFAMAAINNGIALHGGSKIFSATFFVFSDYMRAAVRLAALMKLPVIFVCTHDSVAVGEDGPTHEPIEQLSSWRAMPGLDVLRPADANETVQAWRLAMESKDHPTMLVLTRQSLPNLKETPERAKEGVEKGAYVLSPANGEAEGLILATGSEVSKALEAQKILEEKGHAYGVISMPSFFRFDQQDSAYQESVLPFALRRRISFEAGSTLCWGKYVGLDGLSVGIDRFGLSAPGDIALSQLGMTAENLVEKILALSIIE